MQRRTIASLVALQCVVACGYAIEAQDAPPRPTYARSSASRESTAALADAPASAAVAQADKPVEQVTLRLPRRVVTAPGYLRSLIRVAPNAENRSLRVSIDSDAYYRSSDIQLDGESAPTSHFVDFKGVPAGEYALTVEVIGQTGTRATRRIDFRVLGVTVD